MNSNNSLSSLDRKRIQAVVFDMDGTLYHSLPINVLTALDMAMTCLRQPHRLRNIRVVRAFRRAAERLASSQAGADLDSERIRRCALDSGVSDAEASTIITYWMMERPLRHLARWRRDGVVECFNALATAGVPIGVLSEYPAKAKLRALGLSSDSCIHTGHLSIERAKPDPAGLQWIAGDLGVPVEACLMVGDRQDRDGEMARKAGAPFILVGKGGLGSLRPLAAIWGQATG